MSRRNRPLPDAEAVLAGTAAASIEGLSALIQRVNPTDRDLPSLVVEPRYALKSRFQSDLWRPHEAALHVVPEPSDPGVFSIRHRHSGRDACNAALDSLVDDVRSRQRFLADSGEFEPALVPSRAAEAGREHPRHSEPSPPRAQPVPSGTGRPTAPPTGPAPPPPGGKGADARIAEGEAALAEFDDDLARSGFESALAAGAGSPRAALPLLGLRVDAPGDDAGVLGLVPSLSPATLADPACATLLARAAALGTL